MVDWKNDTKVVFGHECRIGSLVLVLVLVISAIALGFALLLSRQEASLSRMAVSVSALSESLRNLSESRRVEMTETDETVVRLANPASVHCLESGGQSVIARRPDGAEYGLCTFGADRQCEEWAMLRGQCPAGGIDISLYSTPADVYCVVTGHELRPSLVPNRPGRCLVDGQECSAQTLYETGACGD